MHSKLDKSELNRHDAMHDVVDASHAYASLAHWTEDKHTREKEGQGHTQQPTNESHNTLK